MNMYNIKRHWNIIFLHLLAHIIKGVTYTKADIGTVRNGCIPIVRANNIQGDKLDYKDLVWVVESRIAPDQFLRQGDVVVATSSGSKHLVGKTASFDGKQKISCGAFCAILRPNNLVDNLFFKYFFQTQEYRNFISSYAKGSNINNLKNGDLAKIQIPVPPLAEQKRIVRKIEELFGVIDRDIQRLTDTLEQLSQFRQSVLEKLLNNPVYPQISFNDGIEKIIGGSTPSKTVSAYYEGHIPFMTVKDMTSPRPQDTAWHITQEAVDNCSTHIIPANTLITATRVGLGKTVLMPFPVAINQDLKALVLNKNKVNTRFFEFILNAKTTEIISKSRGTTVKGITLEDFKSIKFYLPTLPEQQKIVDEIEKAFRSADKVQKAVQNALEEAKKLKQSILKKAFAGELVPQDPNDKPVNLPVLKGKTK